MKKITIYKSSGGLAHMLFGIQDAIDYCLLNDRDLLIDTFNDFVFMNKFNKYFYIDNINLKIYYDYEENLKKYFISNDNINKLNFDLLKYSKILNIERDYYLDGNLNFIVSNLFENNTDSNNDLINIFGGISKRYIYTNYIKVNNYIIKSFKSKILQKKYISVHFRNTDIKNSYEQFIEKINDTIKKYSLTDLYIATDDSNLYNILINKIQNINIIQYTIPINNGNYGIHHYDSDKNKIIINCLLDIFMILNSTYFIPSLNSGLSLFIINMINNKSNIFNIFSDTIII